MDRKRALIGAATIALFMYGLLVVIRILTRFFFSLTWFLETIALLGFALVLGYVAYRILWGVSDDPRQHD